MRKKYTYKISKRNKVNKFMQSTKESSEEIKGKTITNPTPFYQLFKYATFCDLCFIAFGTFCGFISGACVPLMMMYFSQSSGAIIVYANAEQCGYNMTVQAEILKETLWNTLYKTGLLGVLSFACNYASVVLFTFSCVNQVQKIRCLYMQKIMQQDIAWFDIHGNGGFTTRMTEDLIKIEGILGDQTSTIIHYLSVFIAGSTLAVLKGWEFALICLIYLPVSIICLQFVAWLTRKFVNNETEAYAAAGAIAEEVLSSIRTVVAFGGQDNECKLYRKHLISARSNNIKKALINASGNGVMWFILYASYALSFYYGVSLLIDGRNLPEEDQVYSVQNMLTIFFAAVYATWDFAFCLPYFQSLGSACSAAGKIYLVIDNKPTINLSKGKGKKPIKINGDIKFKNVKFSYPSRKEITVLKNINVSIESGETVALVGSSGCGKSTCIQLLQRFYDPSSGNILIDGIDIKEYDLDYLRSKIGVVGQEPVLFATTIAENIKLGNPNATVNDVEQAAIKANAHAFIMNLPQGYETLVGELGTQLSGGQKQRIAIARALVRKPSILLLDEATSALDTASERQVQNALNTVSKECTTIIIAHRLSTVRKANRILVLSDGQLVEEGTHQELFSRRGMYFDVVISQLSYTVDTREDDNEHYSVSSVDEDAEESQSDNHRPENEEESPKETGIRPLWCILKLNKPESFHIFIGCVSAFIFGATLPMYAYVFGDLVSVLSHPDRDHVRNETHKFCVYFLLIGVVSGICAFLQWYMFSISGEKLTLRVRYLIFKNILKQEMGWFDRKENGIGAITSKLGAGVVNLQTATGQPSGTILNSISAMVIACVTSLCYDWRLSLLTLSIFPIMFIAMYIQGKKLRDAGNSNALLSESNQVAVEAIGNIRTVLSLGCEEAIYNRYVNYLIPRYQTVKRTSHFTGVIISIARILMFICYSISIFYGGYLIIEDSISYTKVFKITESLICGAWYIGYAMTFTPNIQKGLMAANDLAHMLRKTPLIKDACNASSFGWGNGNVRYSKINFYYPTRQKSKILSNFDMSILQGKTVGLVGSSGCGKSTIIQLLQRFYDPDSGSITVGKTNVVNMKLEALRSHMGLVSQEPILFNRTIAENISYGVSSQAIKDQDIVSAAKQANIHCFITSLSLGYQTRLGEKGTLISGGQKQRIAIARALFRNPHVLVLDEATSALDSESEKVILKALENARKGRTCICIAHKLTTLQNSDLICVLDKGQIQEIGTHVELMKSKGIYYSLYRMQQQGVW